MTFDPLILIAVPLQAWTLREVIALKVRVAELNQKVQDLPCTETKGKPCPPQSAAFGSMLGVSRLPLSPDAP